MKNNNFEQIKAKLFYPIIVALMIGGYTSYRANENLIQQNLNSLKFLNKRLDNNEHRVELNTADLNNLKINMPENYVTRREFTKMLEVQQQQYTEIKKNLDRLLEIQLNKNKN